MGRHPLGMDELVERWTVLGDEQSGSQGSGARRALGWYSRSPLLPAAAHGPDHLGDPPKDHGAVPRGGALQRHHHDPHRRSGHD